MTMTTIILSMALTLSMGIQCLAAKDPGRGTGRKTHKPITPIVVVLGSIC